MSTVSNFMNKKLHLLLWSKKIASLRIMQVPGSTVWYCFVLPHADSPISKLLYMSKLYPIVNMELFQHRDLKISYPCSEAQIKGSSLQH